MVDRLEVLKPINGAFVVTEDMLRKIHSHLAAAFPERVEIEFEFANSRTIKSEDLGAMLADSSVANFALKRIDIAGGNTLQTESYARVQMDSELGRAVCITVRGTRQFVLGLEDSLTSEILGGRLPYGWLNIATWPSVKASFVLSLITLMMVTCFFVIYYWYAWLAEHISFLALVGIMLLFPATSLIGPYVAPSAVFAIGRGAQNYKRRRAIIGLMCVPIGLGLFVSIVSGAIT